MERSLWIAKTGLDAQRTRMAIVAHNLANVNTTGFKRGRGVFADLIYQTIRQPGAQSTESSELPSGLMLGTGVRVVATEKLFEQGNIVQTENPLDVALQGPRPVAPRRPATPAPRDSPPSFRVRWRAPTSTWWKSWST